MNYKMLEKFGNNCNQWNLKVNVDKTKVMIFSKGRQMQNLKNFTMNETNIEIDEFSYLGIMLNRTGNFNNAINKQAEKATKAMYAVLQKEEILICLLNVM